MQVYQRAWFTTPRRLGASGGGSVVKKKCHQVLVCQQILTWQRTLQNDGRLHIATGTPSLALSTPTEINTHIGTAPLPWRLTKKAVEVIDARIKTIVYPHVPAGVSKDGVGFIKKPQPCSSHFAKITWIARSTFFQLCCEITSLKSGTELGSLFWGWSC